MLRDGVDENEAIGLGDLRGYFRQMLGAGHSDGDRKAKLGADPCAHPLGDGGWRAEKSP